MRYTDDGFISTEVMLPRDGQRVEYRDVHGEAVYRDMTFRVAYLDAGYRDAFVYSHGWVSTDTALRGYWRPLEASPRLEELQSAIRSLEDKQNALQSDVGRLSGIVEDLEEDASDLEVYYDDELRLMENRIKALEDGRMMFSVDFESYPVLDLGDSDKLSQLEKEGWIRRGERNA